MTFLMRFRKSRLEDERPSSAVEHAGRSAVDELAAQRTELSFEQAAMSGDSALFGSVRTSMALITFGFIIVEYLEKISQKYLAGTLPGESPRRFGLALIAIGIVLLGLEITNHAQRSRTRRSQRQSLFERGLIIHAEASRPSSAMVVALLLLLVGLLAILRIALSGGPQ